mmetsp:Transcript_6653/g.14229  ORF Transcript_6653/g.14229 Transcript_6653/m.14229 type:complete len:210 (-) Transcript_6653:420-1049(-)
MAPGNREVTVHTTTEGVLGQPGPCCDQLFPGDRIAGSNAVLPHCSKPTPSGTADPHDVVQLSGARGLPEIAQLLASGQLKGVIQGCLHHHALPHAGHAVDSNGPAWEADLQGLELQLRASHDVVVHQTASAGLEIGGGNIPHSVLVRELEIVLFKPRGHDDEASNSPTSPRTDDQDGDPLGDPPGQLGCQAAPVPLHNILLDLHLILPA